jgi:hypothetical protein
VNSLPDESCAGGPLSARLEMGSEMTLERLGERSLINFLATGH